MIKRREFIQSALSVSSLSLTGVPAFALSGLNEDLLSAATWFVADTRYTASSTAARESHVQGNAVLYTDGDVTDLWTNTFASAWRERPHVVAGVSGEDVLFVLETLARDHGMTLVHSVDLPQTLPPKNSTPLTFKSWILAPKARLG